MKIERINDNQIKCTLNRSDLAARQIKLSELAYGSEKTKDLFQDMMEQAETEVGFDASDLPLMVEAIPVSMDCIVLMITKVEDPDDIDTDFSELVMMNEEESLGDSLFSNDFSGSLPLSPFASNAVAQIHEKITTSVEKLFSFANLDIVIDFAHHLKGIYDGVNTLYKDNDSNKFYLLLSKSSHTEKEFGFVCNLALEYGSREPMSHARGAFLNEHCEKMLEKSALQILANV